MISLVNKSWVKSSVDPMDPMSQGISLAVFGISDKDKAGMHLSASGESGVSL